jgi:inosose dehydratase
MKIANAPCSWGVLEFGLEGETDLYGKVLDEMKLTGYTGSELGDWGFMPTEPDELKRQLDDRQLCLVGAFVPVNFANATDHDEGLQNALRTAHLLKKVDPDNAKIVLSDDNGRNADRSRNAGRIQSRHGLSLADWKIFARGVENISRTVQSDTGVPCVFHHHCAGYVETPEEVAILMDLTSPDVVNLCFDTGHYAFGGGDPLQGLRKFSDRIRHVHFKDWDKSVFEDTRKNNWDYFEAIRNGIFCELGQGSIDFTSILDELKRQNYADWIVVEQDILPGMGSPLESAQRNRDFLSSIGL